MHEVDCKPETVYGSGGIIPELICHQFLWKFSLVSFVDLIQNVTIEERVTLLEIQVVDLNQDVNFLFDEQVIQDERLLNLEEATDAINVELVLIDDQFDAVDNELESEFCIF